MYKAYSILNKYTLDKKNELMVKLGSMLIQKFSNIIKESYDKFHKNLAESKLRNKSIKLASRVRDENEEYVKELQKQLLVSLKKLESTNKQSQDRQHQEEGNDYYAHLEVFNPEIFIKNTDSQTLCQIMQEIIQIFPQDSFLKHLTIRLSPYLDALEEEEQNDAEKKPSFPINILKCQPSSKPFCEKATQDLYRQFTHHFLPLHKYGSISNFVCEFIEAENGLIYLS